VSQIALVEPLAELGGQARCQVGQQSFAISRAGGATLLELDNVITHTPAGVDLNLIHRAQGLIASALDQLPQAGEQRSEFGFRYCRVHTGWFGWPGQLFLHGWSWVPRTSQRSMRHFSA